MKKWTKWETGILEMNMDSTLETLKQLLPERTPEEIVEKIRLVYTKKASSLWTEDELAIMRGNRDKSVFDLMQLLPNRTFSAITYKHYELRVIDGLVKFRGPRKDWTPDDLKKLKEMKQEGYTNYDISKALDRPLNSVQGKLSTEHIVVRKFGRRNWTTEDISYLHKGIAEGMTIESLATYFDVIPNKIYQKAIHLGFKTSEINTGTREKRESREVADKLRERISHLESELKSKNRRVKQLGLAYTTHQEKIEKLERKLEKRSLSSSKR